MEIDITRLFTETDAFDFSRSIAEYGQGAGPTSWANAKEEGAENPLLATDDACQALRDWARDFGAWDDAERAAWTADECNALLIQYISGNIREIQSLCTSADGKIDWTTVEKLESEGRISGSIYRADDGKIWFSMSH